MSFYFLKLILFCKAIDTSKLKIADIEMHAFTFETFAFKTSTTMRHGFEGTVHAACYITLTTESK